VFQKRYVVFVRLALISGVDSSASSLKKRRKTWMEIIRKNGHTRQIPSSKSLRRMLEAADTQKTLYLWNSNEANNYILHQFSQKGSAFDSMETLGMAKDVRAVRGAYLGVMDTLCAKNDAIKQFLFEKFDGEPERKKMIFVGHLTAYMNNLVNEKTILLNEWHNKYKKENKCVDSYNHHIETVSTREIEALSSGELVSVTAGSDHDLARVSRKPTQNNASDLPVTLRIEVKQCAKPNVNGKQFKMTFHNPFTHKHCAGMYLFQFIGEGSELTTFAALVVRNIELLRVAVGGDEKQQTWSVLLPELEWSDDKKTIKLSTFNEIFNG
jgi:hypothetical protein